MLLIFRNSLFVLGIFLIIPLVMLTTNWHWQPESLSQFSKYLYWVTETAGSPWSIITCGFFTILFALALKIKSPIPFLKLVVILAIAVIAGQLIKSVVKNYTSEPRPYVLWMADNYKVDDNYFYSLTKVEKQNILKDHFQQSDTIPNWLYRHWCNETGYSFPSGHTLFAVTWAFLAVFLLNFKRSYLIISAIIIWGVLVQISRLALGMHHPIDVISSSLIGWFLSLLTYFIIIKCQRLKLIVNQNATI